jgi:Ca2+-binding RTX toxin-like protein
VIAGFDSSTNGIERIDAGGAAIVGTADDNLFHFVNTELRNVAGVSTLGGNDTIHASNLTHDITYDGGEGDDTLFGGSRRDVLIGGTGNDTLTGGGNPDILRPGAGDDIVDGGDGNDTIEVLGSEILGDVLVGGSHFDQLVNLEVDASYQDLVIAGFDSLTNGIERIDAGGAAIVGTEADNLFHFVNTELRNVAGVSTLGGNDTIHASNLTHDITYDGGEGDDTLIGGSRRDILVGGIGDDTLTGGGNRDRFVISALLGVDTIKDMNPAQGDKIDLTAFGFDGWDDFLLQTQASNIDADDDGQEDDVSLGTEEFLQILDRTIEELEESWFLL